MADDPLVKLEHLRLAHFCVSGAKTWCVANGISFDQFCREGVPASRVEATGDALGIKLAQHAREQAKGSA